MRSVLTAPTGLCLAALLAGGATAAPRQASAPPPAPAQSGSDGMSGGYATNLYFLDDGTTDSSLGLTLGGTLCWFQSFDTSPGGLFDVIDTIEIAYGFPGNPGFGVPNGTPAHVCIWDDPNEDGDPSDAQLLVQQATTVQNNDSNFMNSVAIPAVTVQRRFFVGAFLQHNPNRFPASRDTGTPSLGRAFFVGTTTFGGVFDPAHLASVGHTQIFSMDTASGGTLDSVFRVRAVGQGPAIVNYCAPKTNSLGCIPQIIGSGVPRAPAFLGFVVRATNVRNQKPGLLLYGTTGQAATPFQGGLLCVNAPLRRSTPRSSNGSASPANDCTGVYDIDMNAFAHGLYGGSPLPALLVVGTTVNCQWWGRDPGFPAPNNSALTAGLQYPVLP